jgi:hypothetical protein
MCLLAKAIGPSLSVGTARRGVGRKRGSQAQGGSLVGLGEERQTLKIWGWPWMECRMAVRRSRGAVERDVTPWG